MDPEAAKRALGPRAKAVIVVHSFGLPAEMDRLMRLGLPVIEAAAQALGATYRGKPVGSLGVAGTFSFYATKLITTGEGGMLTSDDARILATARDLREYDEKEDDRPRFNYKLTDLQAALGLAQFRRLRSFLRRRERISARYRERLEPLGLAAPLSPPDRRRVYYRYVVKGAKPADHYLRKLRAYGVEARRPVFLPLHRYLKVEGFPGGDEAWERAVSLPLYPALSDREVERVVAAARRAFR
jgi:dTDP-4-amino-4,6-dideoxygalactose transaminase